MEALQISKKDFKMIRLSLARSYQSYLNPSNSNPVIRKQLSDLYKKLTDWSISDNKIYKKIFLSVE